MENTCSGEIHNVDTDLTGWLTETKHPIESVVAASVRKLTRENNPTSKLVQYCFDIAGDQYISEEFYQRFPEILDFLAACGCNNEEVLFLAYVQNHPDIFDCKSYDCGGRIIGQCPKMYCDDCGKQYFLDVENITELMCSRCVANSMKECTATSRRKRYQVYAI